MKEQATKLPVKNEAESTQPSAPLQTWHAVESLRRELDRLFDEFDRGLGVLPYCRSFFGLERFWRRALTWGSEPAVDVSETEKAYEIAAELPGMDKRDIEVTLANSALTIKGEKREENEEKNKDFYPHERRFGAFERYFQLPDGVDREKIEASFKKGILTISRPKTPEARNAEQKIPIRAA